MLLLCVGDPSDLEQKLADRVVELSAEVANLRKLNKARLAKVYFLSNFELTRFCA